MNEMQSLTLNGKKYDSFRDQTARQQLEEMKNNGSDSGQNVNLSTAQIEALHGMFKVCAYDDTKDVSGAYATFLTAFGITDSGEDSGGDSGGSGEDDSGETEKTLTSISAKYSGGDVAVGTAVTALTGVVVTAHYSDGTSAPVTGYTLSGTIAEGGNTVTVSYGGLTTTFTVTGVADPNADANKTVTSISATYSGGDVPVGTALTDLTGIVVTARYSDGTTGTVTGYTLSGTIAEGNNVITATYRNFTTNFSIIGVNPSETYTAISIKQNTGMVTRELYADGGTTLVRNEALPSWSWVSDEAFAEDTEVKFIITPGWETGYKTMSVFVGSAISNTGPLHYCEGFAGETTGNKSYLAGRQEKSITVKAGYKAILVYSNGFAVTAEMKVKAGDS